MIIENSSTPPCSNFCRYALLLMVGENRAAACITRARARTHTHTHTHKPERAQNFPPAGPLSNQNLFLSGCVSTTGFASSKGPCLLNHLTPPFRESRAIAVHTTVVSSLYKHSNPLSFFILVNEDCLPRRSCGVTGPRVLSVGTRRCGHCS